MNTELYGRIETILTETFGVPGDDLAPEATFESLGLDSLDLVELMLVVQEEFDVQIADEELEDLVTVGHAVAAIDEKQRASA
jgi:acyl carrier protein